MRRPPALAALLLTLLIAGCATETTSTRSSYPPIPEPIQETMPKPPVTAEPLMWQPGYWEWNGKGYVWRQGQYVPATGHGNLWMPGYWQQGPAGWSWVPAHWTS